MSTEKSLRQTIEEDFLIALKISDRQKKSCLGLLKSRITELEKKLPTQAIDDDDVIKIILSEVKKRDQTITAIKDNPEAGELIIREQYEKELLAAYLPQQFTRQELTEKVSEFITVTNSSDVDFLKLHIIKHFNRTFKGRFNNEDLKEISEEILSPAQA